MPEQCYGRGIITDRAGDYCDAVSITVQSSFFTPFLYPMSTFDNVMLSCHLQPSLLV